MSFINRFTSRHNRTGNALVATLIVSVTVGLALNLASSRMQSLSAMAGIDSAKLQARLSAESVAAMVEGKLKERGAEDTAFLSQKIEADYPGWALGFPGFANTKDTNTAGLRVGNCIVYWRVEPVKVWSETVKDLSVNADGIYSLNPNMDNKNEELDLALKARFQSDSAIFKENDRNFLFRIVTESYVLKDPNWVQNPSEPEKNPRTDAALRLASAQATRVVQYTLVNLFEYAIFYAAEGETGDLEFWQGTGMAVKGRVHSNGAIYIGGGGAKYMDRAYHTAASGNGGLSIGTAAEPTQVTAVNGIYRMRKPANYVAVMNGDYLSTFLDPYLVPSTGLSGEFNLNGDTPTDKRHTINGIPFTSENDSRSTVKNNNMLKDFGRRVTDQYTGATVVESLANVPKFKGRPFEPEVLGGATDYLYGDSSTTPSKNITDYSLSKSDPKFNGKGTNLYYVKDPSLTDNPGLTFDPAKSFAPTKANIARVTAFNMPLYWQDNKLSKMNVYPPAIAPEGLEKDPLDTEIDYKTGTRSILLNNQLVLENDKDVDTGLVIRERRIPKAPATNFEPYPFANVTGLPQTPTKEDLRKLKKYLKSQYQVRFYEVDITESFFDDLTNSAKTNLPECKSRDQAIVTEEFIINRREAHFMGLFFNEDQNKYLVNVITLNLRRVQDFLANTKMKDLDPTTFAAKEEYAKDHFNGVIYVHRSRRSATYDIFENTSFVFNANARTDFKPPVQMILKDGPIGSKVKSGPIEIFHSGVRVRGGLVADGNKRDFMAAVNWQHDSNGDGIPDSAPLGTSKMTIITPNPMYLWGDINTTPYSDGKRNQRTPVAVFCDSVTLLSAAWNDNNVSHFDKGIPNATHTSYVSSFVINNVPCRPWNAVSEGSGAVANVCRFLENWGSGANSGKEWPYPLKNQFEHPAGMEKPSNYGGQVVFTFMGSLVVMNEQRYGRGVLGAGTTTLNKTGFYSPPFRNLAYNTDLKLAAGQPPEALRALDTTRVVSLVNMFEN